MTCCCATLSSCPRPSCHMFLSGPSPGPPTTACLLRTEAKQEVTSWKQVHHLGLDVGVDIYSHHENVLRETPEECLCGGRPSSSPMTANAVALYSLPLTPSRTSSLDPSISQRLIVLFPELIQYSCSFSKSIESPGKMRHGIKANRQPRAEGTDVIKP